MNRSQEREPRPDAELRDGGHGVVSLDADQTLHACTFTGRDIGSIGSRSPFVSPLITTALSQPANVLTPGLIQSP
jgi:hypothetical protein